MKDDYKNRKGNKLAGKSDNTKTRIMNQTIPVKHHQHQLSRVGNTNKPKLLF